VESEKLLEQLFDKKVLQIIRHFLKQPNQQFYLQEITKSTRVPLSSTHRILKKLLALELIKLHKMKAFKLYSWNDTDQAKYLQYILEQKKTVLDRFVEKASLLEGIQMLILHGEATNEQASILTVGTNIDDNALRSLVVKAKEENAFSITSLTLTPEQYNQMAAMGLFPKKKTILFEAST
jgi:hypothetical protein